MRGLIRRFPSIKSIKKSRSFCFGARDIAKAVFSRFDEFLFTLYSISRRFAVGSCVLFLGMLRVSTPFSYLALMPSVLMLDTSN